MIRQERILTAGCSRNESVTNAQIRSDNQPRPRPSPTEILPEWLDEGFGSRVTEEVNRFESEFLNSFCLCLFFQLCFIKNWSHFIDREFGLRVSRRWRTPKSAISSTAAQNCARTKGGSTFRTFNSTPTRSCRGVERTGLSSKMPYVRASADTPFYRTSLTTIHTFFLKNIY